MTRKPFFPIMVVFFAIALVLVVAKYAFSNLGNLSDVLFVGNLVLYASTGISFRFYIKAVNNNSTQFFIRMMYSAMLVKMVVCIAAVLIYAFAIKPVNKYAILIFFALYFIYTFAEVKIITRLNKEKKNA